MELQNLSSTIDRKKLRENGFLSLLIHILHEPTIATLENNDQTIEQFTAEYYSPTRIEKRRQCSRLLRSVIEGPFPVKEELETLEVFESLRSIIECLYGEYSQESISFSLGRILASLQELLNRGFYFREGFNTFERFGGVFVLLDILFLDCQFRDSILEHVEQWDSLRRLTIQLIGRLIHHSTDVRLMFLHYWSLFEVLAENYHDEQNILARNSIVASFHRLASLPDGVEVCEDCHIVELLTTNAVKCHLAGDRKEELISNLEVLSVLTKSDQSRLDFLSTSGSVDMLLDLLNPHRKYSTFILNDYFTKLVDYLIYKQMNLCTWLGNIRCLYFTVGKLFRVIGEKLCGTVPEVISKHVAVPEVVRSSCRRVKQEVVPIIFYFLAILKLFHDKTERFRQDRKYRNIRGCLIPVCILLYTIYLAHLIIDPFGIYIYFIIFNYLLTDYPQAMTLMFGDEIFQNIFSNLYDVPEALERFRERDGCALFVDLLKYECSGIPDMKTQAIYSICSLKDLDYKPGNEVEKQRLRELGAHWVLKKLQEEFKDRSRDTKYVVKALNYLEDDVD